MTAVEERVRERLLARREQLAGLTATRGEQRLLDLMRRVDDALAAIEVGTWGTCAVCHEPMSRERLEHDPLLTVCLECLSPEDRRALERDLEAAARVQRALLPPPYLRHDGWEVAYVWEPRGAVSGDHVDLVRPSREDEPLHLLLGDVAGKGVAASLLQAHLHALFRALAPSAVYSAGDPSRPGAVYSAGDHSRASESSLAELLERANRLFFEATSAASYATFAALRLHRDGRAQLVNAGHPRPLRADSRGVRPVEGAGLPLGLFAEARYAERELRLGPGETLLLYTDGWTEGTKDEEEYGIGRAAAALRRAVDAPLSDLLAACRDDLGEFLAGSPRGDDLTLVAVRRLDTRGVH